MAFVASRSSSSSRLLIGCSHSRCIADSGMRLIMANPGEKILQRAEFREAARPLTSNARRKLSEQRYDGGERGDAREGGSDPRGVHGASGYPNLLGLLRLHTLQRFLIEIKLHKSAFLVAPNAS